MSGPVEKAARPVGSWPRFAAAVRRLTAELDEAAIERSLVAEAGDLLAGAAVLIRRDGNSLRFAAARAADALLLDEVEASIRAALDDGDSVLASAAQSGDGRILARAPEPAAGRAGAALVAPLRGAQAMLGVLIIVRATAAPAPLSAADLELAQALADQAALCIEQARRVTAVQNERAFYMAAVQGSSVGLIFYDRDLRIIEANDTFLRIVARRRGATIGQTLIEVFPSLRGEQERFLRLIERVLAGESIATREVPYDGTDGITYWDVNHSPIQDSAGSVLGAVSALRDVTERVEDRRRLEGLSRALQQRAAELDLVLEVDPGAIALVRGADLTYIFTNQGYRELLATPATNPVGQRLSERHPFSASGIALNELHATRDAGERRRYDDLPIEAGGQTRYYSLQVVPAGAESDRDRGLLLVLWETTRLVEARRRIEALARQAAARSSELTAVINAMTEGVFVCDMQGTLTLANPTGASMLDLPETLAQAGVSAFSEAAHPRYPNGLPMPVEDSPLVRGLAGETGEAEFLTERSSDGRQFLLRVAYAPVRDPEDGHIVGAVAVANDMTEFRRLERQREEFLSVASHELRTPVASIKGYSQMLLRAHERGLLETARLTQSLATIDHEANRLTELIADLLDTSRIRTGRLQITLRRLDLSALVRTLAERFRDRLDAAHSLRISLLPGATWVHGDAARLEQIVQNLLDNALKYSPFGGAIEVTTGADGVDAVLTVADQGIGIPAEELDRLFEPYARARNASVRSFGGLGLGLFISRTIAQQHHGSLVAASAGEGGGATFTLRLPLAPPRTPTRGAVP